MCVSTFFCVVLSCVDKGVALGWYPVQGVLPNVHWFINSWKLNSEWEQAMRPIPWRRRRRRRRWWYNGNSVWKYEVIWIGGLFDDSDADSGSCSSSSVTIYGSDNVMFNLLEFRIAKFSSRVCKHIVNASGFPQSPLQKYLTPIR
jgi:hypothetical protein